MSCTRPVRVIRAGSSGSGRQKVTSLTQYASSTSRSASPNASNISTVRQATPSAWPTCERAVAAVDHRRRDLGEVGELRGQHQAGRPAPDDQDVDLLGQAVRPLRDGRVRVLDERVAGPVAVEIELQRGTRLGP